MRKYLIALASFLLTATSNAGTFSLFGPATGVLKGNSSTYVTTAAASSDIISLWSGTCNSSTFMRGDGSCQTPAGGGSVANPTGVIGLTAVNGVASSAIRSDGAPALSQAIAPTWSATHIFSKGYTGVAGSEAIKIASALPSLSFQNTAASADEGRWKLIADVNDFSIVVDSDDDMDGMNFLHVTRGGFNVESFEFLAGDSSPNYTSFAGYDTGSSTAFGVQSHYDAGDNGVTISGVTNTSASVLALTAYYQGGSPLPQADVLVEANVTTGSVSLIANRVVMTADTDADVTINAKTICLNDGTNCPAGPAAFSGASVKSTGTTTCSDGSLCAVAFASELYDTGTFHDNVTNNSRITLPSGTGYAQCTGSVTIFTGTSALNSSGQEHVVITVNGAPGAGVSYGMQEENTYFASAGSQVFATLNVTTPPIAVSGGDYAQIYFGGNGYTSVSTASVDGALPTKFSCYAVK